MLLPGLVVGGGSTVAVAEPSASRHVSNDAVEDALASYTQAADEAWTTPAGVLRALSAADAPVTESMSVNAKVRDAMVAAGAPITSAESTTSVTDAEVRDDGTVLVNATISTSFTYGGDGADWPQGSNWSDEHAIVIDQATGVVVSDEVVDPPADDAGVPEEYAPIPSSDERPLTAPGPDVSIQSEPSPDLYQMQGYALEWTLPPNDGDEVSDFNPDFGVYNNNCANFASQVLHAGGWTYKGGVNPYDTANWTPNLTGPGGPSRTWSSASYQYTFVKNNGYEWLPNIWDSTPGNLLYTDWDPNNTPDGEIDHVMVVVFASFGDPSGPLISQKTPNRGAIPLAQSIANAKAQGKTTVWYGLK
ncbi:MAG: hypothetical protein HGA44_15885 [Cellulomonadaceae bacterium]|nr:hypothetical protein [Cellulomonadaceae bacterium]